MSQENEALEQIARAGILHLLAVRENRYQRLNLFKKQNGQTAIPPEDRADEDMWGKKIIERLLAPQIKFYLLDQYASRDDEDLVYNRYYHKDMTAEIVQAQLDALREERKIVLLEPPSAVDAKIRYDLESNPNIKKLKNYPQSYKITDLGFQAIPAPVRQIELEKLQLYSHMNCPPRGRLTHSEGEISSSAGRGKN